MTEQQKTELKNLIARTLQVPEHEIADTSYFVEDLRVPKVMILDLIERIEEQYDCSLPESRAQSLAQIIAHIGTGNSSDTPDTDNSVPNNNHSPETTDNRASEENSSSVKTKSKILKEKYIVILAVIILAAVVTYIIAKRGKHADTPEEAISLYLKAKRSHNETALKKVWWISKDDNTRDSYLSSYIARSKAMESFMSQLKDEYGAELKMLESEGKIRGKFEKEEKEIPDLTKIKTALDMASKENSYLTVYIENFGRFTVSKHGEHWYVDHPYSRSDRSYSTDINLNRALAALFETLEKRIGEDGVTALDLLEEQRKGLNDIMKRYDIPFLVF